jgi:hypothetical protein
LENLAKALDKSSAAHAALERTGWALAFATMHHHDEFEEFLTTHRGELTSIRLHTSKSLGLDKFELNCRNQAFTPTSQNHHL